MERLELRLLNPSLTFAVEGDSIAERSVELTKLVEFIEEGDYLQVVEYFENNALCLNNLLHLVEAEDNPFYHIHDLVMDFLCEGDFEEGCELMYVLILAVAYLYLYVQSNYTGPELTNTQHAKLALSDDKHVLRVLNHLECDGSFPYKRIELPHTLLIARTLLSYVTDPYRASWREHVQLDDQSRIVLPSKPDEHRERLSCLPVLATPPSAYWWGARALVLQMRALHDKGYEQLPALWMEVKLHFHRALVHFCGESDIDCGLTRTSPIFPHLTTASLRQLQAQAWLEVGLSRHHFEWGDRGGGAFARSKEVLGLDVLVTGGMGKRTKFQRQDVAQLYVEAKSSIVSKEASAETPRPAPSSAVDSANPPAAPCEIGRRMVVEGGERGEEAAVREVLLDNIDTGGGENIILEGGVRLTDGSDRGGELHPLDQCVLLCMALNVSNQHAASPLTDEERGAYIERVLMSPKNWQVHSTALLERSWLEYEKRKTQDRAVMQIQALIDQHSTRLTVYQSSYSSVESSAPARERVRFIFCTVYPAVFELKRDLAEKYMQCYVLASAAQYFSELCLWDQLVACYQLMDKPMRAELLIREQLKQEETPYMLTALADILSLRQQAAGATEGGLGVVEQLYERAWQLSQGRYARAKRTLAKLHFDRGGFAMCLEHLDLALQVSPASSAHWFLRGVCCMHLERWAEATKSFLRCVQQDPDCSQAWGNMGAIYLRTERFESAHEVLKEAVKLSREDRRLWENLLSACLSLGKWKEAVGVIREVVRLRNKNAAEGQGAGVVDVRQLRLLVREIVSKERTEKGLPENIRLAIEGDGEICKSEITDKLSPLSPLTKDLCSLLEYITKELKTEGEVWEVIAVFWDMLGDYTKALDVRLKQMRAYLTDGQWEKKDGVIEKICKAAKDIAQALLFKEVPRTEVYAVKMLLQSTAKKLETYIRSNSLASDTIAHAVWQELVKETERVEALYNKLH